MDSTLTFTCTLLMCVTSMYTCDINVLVMYISDLWHLCAMQVTSMYTFITGTPAVDIVDRFMDFPSHKKVENTKNLEIDLLYNFLIFRQSLVNHYYIYSKRLYNVNYY